MAKPSITVQPTSRTAAVGASTTFSVTATGATSYQWFKSHTLTGGGTGMAYISGARSSSYTIASIVTASAGNYIVVVTNADGDTVSNPATLTVTGSAGGSGGSSGIVGIAYQDPADSLVQFPAGGDFEEACAAEFTRSDDRGTADTGTRVFEGSALNLASFLSGLSDGLADHEYPNCGLDSYRVSDVPGNKRRVTIIFRGLMTGSPREAEKIPSSVFGTFAFTTDTTIVTGGFPTIGGANASLEFEAPQTEYRYFVLGDEPTEKMFSGVSSPSTRPIRCWNFQPPNQGTTTTIRVMNRCNRFEAKRAGSGWEVSESWVREFTSLQNPDFSIDSGLLDGVEIIDPEEPLTP